MKHRFAGAAPIYTPPPAALEQQQQSTQAPPAKPNALEMLQNVINKISLQNLITKDKNEISEACKQIDEAFSHLNTADKQYVSTVRLQSDRVIDLDSSTLGEKAAYYRRFVSDLLGKTQKGLEANTLDQENLSSVASLKILLNQFFDFRAEIEAECSKKHALLRHSLDVLNKDKSYDNIKEFGKACGVVTSFTREIFLAFPEDALRLDQYYIDFNLEDLRRRFSLSSKYELGNLYSLIVVIGRGLLRSGFSEDYIMRQREKPVDVDQLEDKSKPGSYERRIESLVKKVLYLDNPLFLQRREMNTLVKVMAVSRMYYEFRMEKLGLPCNVAIFPTPPH